MSTKDYKPSKVIAAFHKSKKRIKGLMGPVGSGKSVACCFEILFHAVQQEPNKDGVRLTRWAIIRNTYPELKSTTIKTWESWFDHTIAPMKYSVPITSRMIFNMEDRTTVDAEVIFMSLNRYDDIKKLLSLELTGAWINECREVPKGVFDALNDRVGRFPPKTEAKLTWDGIILDTNPPEVGHWYYNLAEVQQPFEYDFFKQPPALLTTSDKNEIEAYDSEGVGYKFNPDAENVQNQQKGARYWLEAITSKSTLEVSIYQQGFYGKVMSGRPVYPEYNNAVHYLAEPIKYYKDRGTLFMGWDFGLTPACAIFQIHDETLYLIEELTSDDMGITQFGDLVKKHVERKYQSLLTLQHVCGADPAGNNRSETDEKTCIKILRGYGFNVTSAGTQNPTLRREAVASFLRYRHNESPNMLLSSNCPKLHAGFQGDYKYRRLQISGVNDVYKEVPDKNHVSHIHDALQYGVMVAKKRHLTNRKRVKLH